MNFEFIVCQHLCGVLRGQENEIARLIQGSSRSQGSGRESCVKEMIPLSCCKGCVGVREGLPEKRLGAAGPEFSTTS